MGRIEKQLKISNVGLRNGIMYGGSIAIISLILFFINPLFLLKFYITFPIGLFLITFFCIKAGREERNLDADGLLSYGDALLTMIITIVTGVLIYSVVEYCIYNFLWTDYADAVRQEAINTDESVAKFINPEAEIPEEAIEELNKQDFSYGIGSLVLAWLTASILGTIYALILALFVRKNQ